MNKEYRTATTNFRYDAEARTIEGYAVVFDVESVMLGDGCTESIERSAITEDLILNSDILACIDHDARRPFARSKKGKGSLELNIDDTGLHFRCALPNNKYGDEAAELIARGDIDACSFCFTYDDSDSTARTYTRKADGSVHRSIKRIDALFDVSIVHQPAYPQTSVTARHAIYDTMANVDAVLEALENEINSL